MAEEFGKYRLINKIAQGGMAEVFLATQSAALPGFEKQIAIKRIFPNLATDENMRTMFLDEATIAARLNHPNIVQIYDVGEVDQYLFLAMEYVDGYDFRNVLVKAQQKGVSVPYPLAVNVIMNAAAGLHHAHALVGSDGKPMKVIHRDMSPQNILVSKGGNVKVCDFGVAKAEVRTGMTRAGELKGKISYMSPEQIEGAVEIDHRSDIFSLGVVLYEATTMTRLFRQGTDYEKMRNILDGNIKPPIEVTPGYPEDLQLIVLKCLANNRDDRYQTAKDLQVALDGWLSKNGVSQSALELERFLAFLFEDAPISQSSEPGIPSSFSALRGSISRKLVVPKLDALSNKPNAIETAFDQSPTHPSRILTEGSPFRQGTSTRSRLTNNFGTLSGVHSKAELEAKAMLQGQQQAPYYNGTQQQSGIIAAAFSKPADNIPNLASNDFPSEAEALDEEGEPSIAEAVPTSQYQVLARPAINAKTIKREGVKNPPTPNVSTEIPRISQNPADNFEGIQGSVIKNAGPPPKRREAQGSQLDFNAEDVIPPDPATTHEGVRRSSHPTPKPPLDTVQPYVEPFDETPPKDGGMGSTVIIILVVLAVAGVAGYFIMKGSSAEKSKEGESNTQPVAKVDDNIEMTKLSAYEPNVTWVVNGRIPKAVDGNNVGIPKGGKSLVTAYKKGFLPGFAVVTPGETNPERINMSVAKGTARGILKITSTPPGADVYVDGEKRGRTPADISELSPDFPHLVILKSETHASYVAYVAVEGEKALDVILKTKKPTQTDINFNIKPDGASVTMDGVRVSLPGNRLVKSGSIVQIRNEDPKFFPFTYVIDTTNLGTVDLDFPMVADERPRGLLTLRVEPAGTKIFVAGASNAIKGLEKQPMVSGRLPIVLEGPEGQAKIDLEIYPNQENLYQLQLNGTQIVVKKRPHEN